MNEPAIASVVEFWFAPAHRQFWFRSTPDFDAEVADRYLSLWQKVTRSPYNGWLYSARGCLALALIYDQFPLHMFRGKAEAYASESEAVYVTKTAQAQYFDDVLTDEEVAFLYMPLMHSENYADQQLSVECFARRGLQSNLRFARHHHDLVRRFGRFPHRNAVLGRISSQAELDYLASDKAFLG